MVQVQPSASPSGGQIPPPPSGTIVMAQPASTESGQPSPLASVASNGMQKTGAEDALENTAIGAGKGLESTIAGVGDFLKKAITATSPLGIRQDESNLMEKIIPSEGVTAEKEQSKPVGLAQQIGYGGETLAEFMLGDEALSGLSAADKYAEVAKMMKFVESSPRAMEALKTGANIAKAAEELGPEAKAAIKGDRTLARLVSWGVDTAKTMARQGAIQAAQTGIRTGDVKQAAEAGGEQALASGVLGGAFGALGRVAGKAGEAGKAVEEASAAGRNAPTNLELGQKVSDQINDAETKMHGDFESGIQKLKGDLGDQKVPYAGSPLQKAAQEALQGKTEAKGVLGGAFQGLAGGSDESKKFLNSLNDPKNTGDMNIDELIQYRQQLGEKIGVLTKGGTSSADRADVQVYQKLRDGIDDTISNLAKQSGKPEAAQDYEALRAAYKDKVKLFQSPAMQAMSAPGVASETKLDNASKYLLSGGNKLDKINTLSETIGEPAVKDLGKGIIQRQLQDASSETGQINPAKFVKNFKQIDSLSPEIKSKLFDANTVQGGLDNLSKNLNTAANYQKLIRAGIALNPVSGMGLLLGTLASGDAAGARDLLDKIANRPAMWSAFRTAGKIGAALEESPAARRIGTAAKYGAGSALGNVMQGAKSLAEPEDQNVVYTNQ